MARARSQPYSELRHMAWSIWLNHDPANCYMLILQSRFTRSDAKECTAYFDAAGDRREPIFFVSGFVGSEKGWLQFEKKWASLLDEYDIKKPFHTTDYISGEHDD